MITPLMMWLAGIAAFAGLVLLTYATLVGTFLVACVLIDIKDWWVHR